MSADRLALAAPSRSPRRGGPACGGRGTEPGSTAGGGPRACPRASAVEFRASLCKVVGFVSLGPRPVFADMSDRKSVHANQSPSEASPNGSPGAPRWRAAERPARPAGSHLLRSRRLRHHCGRRHPARPGAARDLGSACRWRLSSDLSYRELAQSAGPERAAPRLTIHCCLAFSRGCFF